MKTVFSLIALAGAASIASAVVPTVNVGNWVINGDFVAASGSSRTSFGVPNPFGIAMPGIGGGAVVKSYAVWNMLTSTPGAPGESSITVNGVPVFGAGNFAAPDLCWGTAGVSTYIADVTGLVVHGGVNMIGAGDDFATGALGEGVSLLTVYADGSLPLNNIDVFWNGVPGAIANTNLDGVNRWVTTNPYIGGPAHGFTNALDGQPAGDDFIINGGFASGLYGTGFLGDAWLGNVGPFYDHAEGNWAPFMAPGFIQDVGSISYGDCIGHTFGALAFPIPAPSSLALIGLGGLVAGRRRR